MVRERVSGSLHSPRSSSRCGFGRDDKRGRALRSLGCNRLVHIPTRTSAKALCNSSLNAALKGHSSTLRGKLLEKFAHATAGFAVQLRAGRQREFGSS
jgi:hypothetical protein